MAQLPQEKIQVLFALCLAKAKVSVDKKGFQKLSEALSQEDAFEEVYISPAYLDDRIFKQLEVAQKEGKEHVKLSPPYINKLAAYAGFGEMEGFFRAWEMPRKYYSSQYLVGAARPLVTVFCTPDSTRQVQAWVDKACLLGEAYPVKIKEVKPTGATLASQTKAIREQGGLAIAWITPTWLSTFSESDWETCFPGTDLAEGQLVPVWSKVLPEDVPESIHTLSKLHRLEPHHIPLILRQTWVLANLNRETTGHKTDGSSPTQVTNIHDAGTVFLGNVGEIKGEYMAARDMHINIDNRKND